MEKLYYCILFGPFGNDIRKKHLRKISTLVVYNIEN
jgi:hypothetical protein